jgi:hypothetical protein
MMVQTIAAADVRPGDRIYSGGPIPAFAWVRVRTVRTAGGHAVIETSGWSTWKHPREGIAVQRDR